MSIGYTKRTTTVNLVALRSHFRTWRRRPSIEPDSAEQALSDIHTRPDTSSPSTPYFRVRTSNLSNTRAPFTQFSAAILVHSLLSKALSPYAIAGVFPSALKSSHAPKTVIAHQCRLHSVWLLGVWYTIAYSLTIKRRLDNTSIHPLSLPPSTSSKPQTQPGKLN